MHIKRTKQRSWALTLATLMAAGCGARRIDDTLGGESHFLQSCSTECGDLQCIDQVCTLPCTDDDVCHGLVENASCERSSDTRSCDYTCEPASDDCAALGETFVCQSGVCRDAGRAPDPELSCTQSGKQYADGEYWRCEDGCNSCWCKAGEVATTLILCAEEPPEGACAYDGTTYEDGESWTCTDGCNTCSCSQGEVTTTDIACVPEECQLQDDPYAIEWCPQTCEQCTCPGGAFDVAGGLPCQALPNDCTFGNDSQANGSTWSCDCNTCSCNNGVVTSTNIDCGSGSDTTCEDGGAVYGNGDVWKCSDGCNRCQCYEGEVVVQNFDACADGGAGICSLPLQNDGNCEGAIERYYFNTDTGRCESFTYAGCGGNENRFSTLLECEDWCGGGVEPDAG